VCSSFLQAFVRGPSGLNGDPANLAIQWRQLDAGCPDGVKTVTLPFPASIDATQKAVVMELPFDRLTPAERGLLSSALLMNIQGSTRTNFSVTAPVAGTAGATAPQFDQTPMGNPWGVGSDVPPDVPCTTNCPSA
jgi:hypothetical protein